ncbi:hypothetical protein PT974_00019 [Cladobotryum mycophilum]|uniref:VWFA domain-containing protein n=1 Tax=Cladobotryum mycophilum TaxID=491253 RepID=A0ABR0SZP2_9HYPO
MANNTALQEWALPQLQKILPLDNNQLEQLVSYASNLSQSEAAKHLESLLGDSPESFEFITCFMERRAAPTGQQDVSHDSTNHGFISHTGGEVHQPISTSTGQDTKQLPRNSVPTVTDRMPDEFEYHHTNAVIEASNKRAMDEQYMQGRLQELQYQYNIFNSDLEPEHEVEGQCYCDVHRYAQQKYNRLDVQEMWARAVMYPGEKFYNDNPYSTALFSGNPYRIHVVSPYGNLPQLPRQPVRKASPKYYTRYIESTIALNSRLNREAQSKIDAHEPKRNIWDEHDMTSSMDNMNLIDEKHHSDSKSMDEEHHDTVGPEEKPSSRLSSIIKAMGIKTPEERAIAHANTLRRDILYEEKGRWPDQQHRQIVATYQAKIGIAKKATELRAHCPIQYLHLLRGVILNQFHIEAASGWRGITPSWRGYEDLAEERLYWVLNHREGDGGMRMKPDFISEMKMANARMARAVEPPPLYFSTDDTCQVQHTSKGYSKQVMPSAFHSYDRPEVPTDDTMIMLDVSGSMDFDPVRPDYQDYLITGFSRSNQPKNKDVAKAIIRRFTDAMANHDHQNNGYELVTFSSEARHIGKISRKNFNRTWYKVDIGGGTRVMTGWQKVKELHFEKHAGSATYHPVYGWQAGPQTPVLRLLLLLDGEASDMDEFEMDLLGLSWAHVTIFLIGVDDCPHHHRHANELERISQANHHVSFVDAQGNCPERYVTHELLKRHLGYDVSMAEFQEMETLPPYEGP